MRCYHQNMVSIVANTASPFREQKIGNAYFESVRTW